MKINEYIILVNRIYARGNATEHSYRGILSQLIENAFSEITVTNEPTRVKCGAPDYVVSKKEIPVGYIEAKDIDKNLDTVETSKSKDQIQRYLNALENFILTNYLTFYFYRYGEKVQSIQIAEIVGNKIKPIAENFSLFENLLTAFVEFQGETIRSAEKLAVMMAHKAQLMKDIFYRTLITEDKSQNTSLRDQLKAFQKILIHDLNEKRFADIYAQTIAYGLFAARFHKGQKPDEPFSRRTAGYYVPRSNPFLRKLFGYIAGPDLDERVSWVVDALAEVFKYTDVDHLLESFHSEKSKDDPIIHFYETFLKEYDPTLRKKRGVYYTPDPVVNFIVRAVDDILKKDFQLSKGLADTSQVKLETRSNGKTREKEFHKVQILDPAAGTGTFLAEVIKKIHANFKGQEGIWEAYVEEHLKPRLHGFEILMTSYAMCHLKLDLLLQSTGYHASEKMNRFSVYLTNSLEEVYALEMESGFIDWLTQEAKEANKIKQDIPVMVVIGNPPYSGESQNKGKWIMGLMEDYKKEPNIGSQLEERNPKWLNDDYVKFLRYGEHLIANNQEGILAFINNHGFLDNPTFRGMRWHLLQSFDHIYIIDLHGNTRKKETCPDGSPDKNVFDIQEGVSINLFVKTNKKSSQALAKVKHFDLYGSRELKYKYLSENSLKDIPFQELSLQKPQYFFVQKDLSLQAQYNKGFAITEMFPVNSVGIVTARDSFTIHDTPDQVKKTIHTFLEMEDEEARAYFDLGEDVRDWKVHLAKKDLIASGEDFENHLVPINYRPFDKRYTYYTGNSKGFHCMPRDEVMSHFLQRKNVGLIAKRGHSELMSSPIHVSKYIIESRSWSRPGMQGIESIFPLYIYEEESNQIELYEKVNGIRRPNFKKAQLRLIEESLNLKLVTETEQKGKKNFSPLDLLDYIYAILHSPAYRKKYEEFLKIDFPRIPYPKSQKVFWQLTGLGSELRQIHLLESPVVEKFITKYPVTGGNPVDRVRYEAQNKSKGRVHINSTQYFENVPLATWEFYIGGYQPAQKWLKDRKTKHLSFDEVAHYQKIIVALDQTDKLMKEIDKMDFINS